MPKANERQEGGNHYRQAPGIPQHWDLATAYHWDPFQYQIIKYIMRWKEKHSTPEKRLEDLKKARHFIDKYIEEAATWDALPAEQVIVRPRSQGDVDHEWELQERARVKFSSDGFMAEGMMWQCQSCKARVKANSPLGALSEHPSCPPAPAPRPQS
jgi:hypothetical protein